MSPHSPNPLERLLRLNRSSATFNDEVSNVLYGREYERWVQRIEGDDVVGLVDFLDGVRRRDFFSAPCSSRCRPSIPSPLAVPVPEDACENSDTYAARK